MLFIAQWFAQVLLTDPNEVKNDYAVLTMFGDSGCGKSLIVKALSMAMNAFKLNMATIGMNGN